MYCDMTLPMNRYVGFLRIVAVCLSLSLPVLSISARTHDDMYPDTCAGGDISGELSVAASPSWVLPSNMFLRGANPEGKRVSAAFSGRLEYALRFAPGSAQSRLYPNAWQGIGVGVSSFYRSGILGSPVELYMLQGSRIASLSSRLSIDYEWNFGASFGWKHAHHADGGERLPEGVGSSVNAYIGLAFMLSYQATKSLTLRIGPEIAHYSNGNTSLPNPGVNRLGMRLSATWRLHGWKDVNPVADWSGFKPGISYDVTVWGAWRKWGYTPSVNSPYTGSGILEVPGDWGVFGLNFNPLYRFNPVVAVGPAIDLLYDDGANLSPHYEPMSPVDAPKFYRQSLRERIMGGLSLRVEISMPIFSVNIGIGHSVFAPRPERSDIKQVYSEDEIHAVDSDLRGFYQTFNLKTRLWRGLYLNTGYRLVDFSKSGNLMLGLGYTWR